jgi:hypothetical protein
MPAVTNTGCAGLERRSAASAAEMQRRAGDALEKVRDVERALDNSDIDTSRRSLGELKRILQQIVVASPDSFGDT